MKPLIKSCLDFRPAAKPIPAGQAERMAFATGARWSTGTIVASFLDGEVSVQQQVQACAKLWEDHANIKIFFRQDPKPDVRISFTPGGSWSCIGNEAKRVGLGQPTMNLGWLTAATDPGEVRRVVLHEFGHALGCVHEHQNPAAGIRWNKQAVYDHYAGEPNFWTPDLVDTNIFQTYDKDLTAHTAFDARSIMIYPIAPQLTEDGFSVDWNRDLSDEDKTFIGKMYP